LPAGDAAFSGLDMLTPADQLAPGQVAAAVNAWIVGGEYRQRPAEELLPWASPSTYARPQVDQAGDYLDAISSAETLPPRWISERIYLPGTKVVFAEDEEVITVEIGTNPDYAAGENWIDVVSDAAGLGIEVGMYVESYGIHPETRVVSVSGATVLMDRPSVADFNQDPSGQFDIYFTKLPTPVIYQRGLDTPGPQVATADPATATTKWTEIGAADAARYLPRAYPARLVRWEAIPEARCARAAARWTDAAGLEWLAVAERHALRLAAPGGAALSLGYPAGVRASEQALLAAGAGWIVLSPSPSSALAWWAEGAPGFSGAETYESPDADSLPLPGGDALLWTNESRLAVARGDEIYVGRILSTRYDPTNMVLRLTGGTGKIRALIPFQGKVIAFKDRGIWLLDLTGTPADWSILTLTVLRGTSQPGSIASWGDTLTFWDRGELYTLDTVFGQGTGGVATQAPGLPSLAALPLTEPIRPGLAGVKEAATLPTGETTATWPKALRPPVLAAVWQERLWLAVPKASTNDSGWGHEVWLYHIGRRQWEGVWRNTQPWQIVSWLLLPEGLAALEWQGGVFRWCARAHPDEDGALLDITSRGYAPGPGVRADQRRLSLRVSGQGFTATVETRAAPAAAWNTATTKTPSATAFKRIGLADWKPDNSTLNHGDPDREDYAVTLPGETSDFLHLGTAGIEPTREQVWDLTTLITGEGPYAQVRLRNTRQTGFLSLGSIAWLAFPGRRDARNI
jgi:hypothetical protein